MERATSEEHSYEFSVTGSTGGTSTRTATAQRNGSRQVASRFMQPLQTPSTAARHEVKDTHLLRHGMSMAVPGSAAATPAPVMLSKSMHLASAMRTAAPPTRGAGARPAYVGAPDTGYGVSPATTTVTSLSAASAAPHNNMNAALTAAAVEERREKLARYLEEKKAKAAPTGAKVPPLSLGSMRGTSGDGSGTGSSNAATAGGTSTVGLMGPPSSRPSARAGGAPAPANGFSGTVGGAAAGQSASGSGSGSGAAPAPGGYAAMAAGGTGPLSARGGTYGGRAGGRATGAPPPSGAQAARGAPAGVPRLALNQLGSQQGQEQQGQGQQGRGAWQGVQQRQPQAGSMTARTSERQMRALQDAVRAPLPKDEVWEAAQVPFPADDTFGQTPVAKTPSSRITKSPLRGMGPLAPPQSLPQPQPAAALFSARSPPPNAGRGLTSSMAPPAAPSAAHAKGGGAAATATAVAAAGPTASGLQDSSTGVRGPSHAEASTSYDTSGRPLRDQYKFARIQEMQWRVLTAKLQAAAKARIDKGVRQYAAVALLLMELLQHNTEGAARLTQTEARRRTEHVLATQLPLLQQWSEMQGMLSPATQAMLAALQNAHTSLPLVNGAALGPAPGGGSGEPPAAHLWRAMQGALAALRSAEAGLGVLLAGEGAEQGGVAAGAGAAGVVGQGQGGVAAMSGLLPRLHDTLVGEVSSLQSMMGRLYDVSAAASAAASMRASLALTEQAIARKLQRYEDQDQDQDQDQGQEWGQRDWEGNRYGGQVGQAQEEDDEVVRAAGFFARGVPLDPAAVHGPGGIDAALKALGLDVA